MKNCFLYNFQRKVSKLINIVMVITARLEFGDRQPANAGQKYLLACHPDSGSQETAGQPISRQSTKL